MPDDSMELILSDLLGASMEAATQILTLYLPDKDKDGMEIKNLNLWVQEAQRVLTSIGGGSTSMPPADGTWQNPENNEVFSEKTRIIYTYVYPDRFEQNIFVLKEFLHRFGRETNQGEVAVEFNRQFIRIRKFS